MFHLQNQNFFRTFVLIKNTVINTSIASVQLLRGIYLLTGVKNAKTWQEFMFHIPFLILGKDSTMPLLQIQ